MVALDVESLDGIISFHQGMPKPLICRKDAGMESWNTSEADWEMLIWAATYPKSTKSLRSQAIDELVLRLGSNEAVLDIVQERLAVGVPIGALPDWMPDRFR